MAIGTETNILLNACARFQPSWPKRRDNYLEGWHRFFALHQKRMVFPTVDPEICATDLLGQAEHGYNSQYDYPTEKLASKTLSHKCYGQNLSINFD